MDQSPRTPFDNPTCSPPPRQPGSGVFGRAVATVAVWSGRAVFIGGGLVLATSLLPQNLNPFHHLATGLGEMEAAEIKAATAAKAEQARQLAQRQAVEAARVAALHESMEAEKGIGQLGDAACALSFLFGTGRDTEYADLRDGLRSACGVSGAIRQHMMNEFTRNLDPGSK